MGIITLPKELRDHIHIEEGNVTFASLIMGNGVLVFESADARVVDDIAQQASPGNGGNPAELHWNLMLDHTAGGIAQADKIQDSLSELLCILRKRTLQSSCGTISRSHSLSLKSRMTNPLTITNKE